MKIKVLTSLIVTVAFLAVGCHTEPTPDKPDKPAPTDGVVFTANYFDCEYYGDYYTPGVGNYYIHLSDNGFTDSGYALPNSTYYRLDLYSDLYDDAEGGALHLPVGTYTLDTEDTLAHGTFSVAWSKYLRSDAEGEFSEELSFEDLLEVLIWHQTHRDLCRRLRWDNGLCTLLDVAAPDAVHIE